MVLYSFFDEYDFSEKTIIPFNVHNGSRFSGTIATIQDLEPNAEVITDGFTVSEGKVAEAAGDVADWLRGWDIRCKEVGWYETQNELAGGIDCCSIVYCMFRTTGRNRKQGQYSFSSRNIKYMLPKVGSEVRINPRSNSETKACTCVISLVTLVTREPVPKRSGCGKENDIILPKQSFLIS